MKHDTGLRSGRKELWTDDEVPHGSYRIAVEMSTRMRAIERTYVNPDDFRMRSSQELKRLMALMAPAERQPVE